MIVVPADSLFGLDNLPLAVGHDGDGRPRAWVAIGDHAVDLAALHDAGVLDGLPSGCFARTSLNEFFACGPAVWAATRARLQDVLSADEPRADAAAVARSSLALGVPVAATDYVDFYSSIHHATNLGRLFRPDGEALLPNWRQLPVGYHGRVGTFVADGAEIPRPSGLRLVDGAPSFGPSLRLDIELEVGTVVGVGNERGVPISVDDAGDHLYGMCLVNDWSARDIQAYEYQPLGPFLGKSFATSIAPWVVSFAALDRFRVEPPAQDPTPAPYLVPVCAAGRPADADADQNGGHWGFDLGLRVLIESAAMRSAGIAPVVVSETSFADMYWTPAQQLAHLTVNGASCAPGDLFASGTVSGPTPGTEGSFIELSWNGERPIELPDGTTRSFLDDGDRVVLEGWAGTGTGPRIGLGSVAGTIVSASTR